MGSIWRNSATDDQLDDLADREYDKLKDEGRLDELITQYQPLPWDEIGKAVEVAIDWIAGQHGVAEVKGYSLNRGWHASVVGVDEDGKRTFYQVYKDGKVYCSSTFAHFDPMAEVRA